MKIDRDMVKLIRDRLQDALEPVAKGMKLSVEVGHASFTNNNVSFKVVLAVVGQNGESITPEAESFSRMAELYGIDPDALHKDFEYGGKTYKIMGLAPRRSRFPVVADRQPDGKGFKFPIDVVKAKYPAKKGIDHLPEYKG